MGRVGGAGGGPNGASLRGCCLPSQTPSPFWDGLWCPQMDQVLHLASVDASKSYPTQPAPLSKVMPLWPGQVASGVEGRASGKVYSAVMEKF